MQKPTRNKNRSKFDQKKILQGSNMFELALFIPLSLFGHVVLFSNNPQAKNLASLNLILIADKNPLWKATSWGGRRAVFMGVGVGIETASSFYSPDITQTGARDSCTAFTPARMCGARTCAIHHRLTVA